MSSDKNDPVILHAVVALWEGNSLSARLRWVRFPSAAPNNLGAVVGYGFALQAYCLEGFDSLGLHQCIMQL